MLAAAALGGCAQQIDQQRQSSVDSYCQAPSVSGGSPGGIAQCRQYFQNHPAYSLPRDTPATYYLSAQAPDSPPSLATQSTDSYCQAPSVSGGSPEGIAQCRQYFRRLAIEIAQAAPPKSSTTEAITRSTTTVQVPLTRTPGGSLIVAASINGSAPIRFTLDSGAEALVLPSSMAWQLFQQGVIDKAEFLGGGVSELANGSQTRDLRFRLRSVNIGGIVVQNITCVVVDGDGGALLGQAVLSKLRSWKIDNERQTLDIS